MPIDDQEEAERSIMDGKAGPSPVSRPRTAPSDATSPGIAERLNNALSAGDEQHMPAGTVDIERMYDALKKDFFEDTLPNAGPAIGHGGAPSGVSPIGAPGANDLYKNTLKETRPAAGCPMSSTSCSRAHCASPGEPKMRGQTELTERARTDNKRGIARGSGDGDETVQGHRPHEQPASSHE